MKLSPIAEKHIIEAGELIDYNGIPPNYIHSKYWVELPNGREYPFKHLVREAYKLTDGNENVTLDFQSYESYWNYVKLLGFRINYYKEQLNFFTLREIEHYQNIAGGKYRKEKPNNVRNGVLLRPLVKKLNLWAKESLTEDFKVQVDNHWHWSGTIKTYLWLRIYREGDSKNVYFVFGVNDKGELYLELNCQYSNHSGGSKDVLPEHKIIAFEDYLDSSDFEIKIIDKNELVRYDWDKLIKISQDFIYKYAPLYDELEKLILDKETVNVKKEYILTPSPLPLSTKSYTKIERTFEGRKTDWSKKNTVSKLLGDEGEKLVILHEQKKLHDAGLHEKAEQVHKKLDGEGYDILSFDENGNEIHIEVKTTSRNLDEPFYMSLNEVSFFKDFPENYYLYRLFDYSYINKSAKFYILSAKELEQVELNATNYEVVINK